MKFDKLSIQNFLTITGAEVQLKDRGLHLIQGQNLDDSSATSNGAGKSSVVDALCWCLFGETAREVKGDKVVNRAAKKDCRVELWFEVGHTRYRAIRHRKHATFKNQLIVEVAGSTPGDAPTDLSRGTDAETQKVLEKIIGCSYEVFIAAVYSGQEAMPDLPRMKDRELKTLIEEAAGLQRIERAYMKARADALEASGALQKIVTSLDSASGEKARADAALDDAAVKFDAWEGGRATRIAETEEALGLAVAESVRIEAKLRAAIPGATKAKARIAEIDADLANHNAAAEAVTAASSLVRSAELAVDSNHLRRLAGQVVTYRTKIANAEQEVKQPCSECGTELSTMTPEAFVEHQQRHLEAAEKTLAEAKVKAAEQMADLAAKRARVVELTALVPDVTALVTERQSEAEKLEACVEIGKGLDTARSSVTAYKDQLAARTSESNIHATAKAISEKRVQEASERIAALVTERDSAAALVAIRNAVVKVFGPAGVRAQILDTVTPFLNDRTADYLSALSDGHITATWTTLTKSASGELKEKFSIDVEHAKGGDSFAEISGGEKRKVRLACALALQDLVASRATQPIDLWIGDEIDDALDPAGLERLMTILERKARERGTVLVISHSDLRDWIDNITTVTKAEQWKSTMEGSLCV